MKSKIILLAIFILTVGRISAQSNLSDSTEIKKTAYRAELGYAQQFRYGNKTTTSPFQVISGGVSIAYPLKFGIGLESGITYSYAFGKRVQKYPHTGVAKYDYKAHWLSIPLKATYTLPIFWDMKLFFFGGTITTVGLSHNENISFTQRELKPKPDIKLPYPVSGRYNMYENDLRRLSILLDAGGGIQWKNYRLKSGYNFGINNISKIEGRSERMRGWYVSLGYEF